MTSSSLWLSQLLTTPLLFDFIKLFKPFSYAFSVSPKTVPSFQLRFVCPMLSTLLLIILPFQDNQGKFQPQINFSISFETKLYPESNLPTLTHRWALLHILSLYHKLHPGNPTMFIFLLYYIVDISNFCILIETFFFTPCTSSFSFSRCFCTMFIERVEQCSESVNKSTMDGLTHFTASLLRHTSTLSPHYSFLTYPSPPQP